jgi:hypothetical protein
MSKCVIAVAGAALLLLSLAAISFGQVQTTTVTKVQTTQNPDGTYTIVEYPVGKQTTVTLNPVGLTGATGTATIIRSNDGSTVTVNLNGLPANVSSLNLYAVDPTGALTLLGPIQVTNGVGTFTTTTPLSRFMLIASPDAGLTAYEANTKIFFRSAVPTGLSVIPLSGPVGEQVAATVAPTSEYAVPMLGIPTFKRGDDTKLKINFAGAMEGARANIFIEPDKKTNRIKVKMRFHDLKEAPKNTTYVLWAVSPDNQFQNLGQIVNVKGRNEAEINSEVTFPDFGLFLTTEEVGAVKTIIKPAGHRVGIIQLVP